MPTPSELRRDIVSGDWVVVATGRAKRPHDFVAEKKFIIKQHKKDCPFEFLPDNPILVYAKQSTDTENKKPSERNWWVEVIPNKFPAFSLPDQIGGEVKKNIFGIQKNGPYESLDGIGFHEVVVTADHNRWAAQMSVPEVELMLRAFQERYLEIKKNYWVKYISIFQNHGRNAGASIDHPHSQIIAIPVIPPDVGRSIKGSKDYFRDHKACVHCLILDYEIKEKIRIVYENDDFVIIAPFASKNAFESRIFPKKHGACFEEINGKTRLALADALKIILAKLSIGLKDPDYNFFIHTAPTGDYKEFDHYHWHLEIVPKTSVWAGFEIGTGIEISTIAPETAADFLKKIKI